MIKIIRVIALLSFIFILACTSKLESDAPPPDDLIPRDTMISIMIDFRLMDASLIQDQRQANAKIYDLKYYRYLSILDNYNISREQFQSSFDYYQNDLNVIDEMFAESINRLKQMKDEIRKEEETTEPK